MTTDFIGHTGDVGRAVDVIQPNGQIVVAGTANSAGGSGFALVRHNSNGSLDTTFGGNGTGMTTPDYNSMEQATAMAIQPNGQIVVVGEFYQPSGYTEFELARYNSNGTLDTSFGDGGKVLTSFGGYDRDLAQSVAIQSDALGNAVAIVAAGSSYQLGGNEFAVARYNLDGTLDTTFGNGGKVLTAFGSSTQNSANGVAIQGDGRIVAAGVSYQSSDNGSDFALARYNTNGSLDTTFGNGTGKVLTNFGSGSNSFATSVAIHSDANGNVVAIVAAGSSYQSSTGGYDFALARYNSDGSLDTSFGNGAGKVATDFGGPQDIANTVAIQPNGQIVAAGESYQSSTGYNFALARYNSNGSLDSYFGSDGKIVNNFGYGLAIAYGVAIQSNQGNVVAIVAAGVAYQLGVGYDFAVASYTNAGSLNTGFNGTGTETTNFNGPTDDYGRAVATGQQADGKIVVAGYAEGDFALARYNKDGSLDTSFGNGGEVLTDFSSVGGFGGTAESVAIQDNGKIMVAGFSWQNGAGYAFALARYNTNGSLDTTFGNGTGEVLTSFGSGTQNFATSMAIQPDGGIVVAGYSRQPGTYLDDFALARYNSDGSLDTSFGNNGEILTSFGSYGTSAALSVAIQSDSQGNVVAIVAAGGSIQPKVGREFALARYNKDGSMDTTFGSGGEVLTSFGGLYEQVNSVAIQNDGRIVAAGTSLQKKTSFNFALARYNSDGSLDKSFGKNGEVLTSFSNSYGDDAFAMTLQGDKIVVAGESDQISTGYDFALARYNSDGSLDPDFGTGGLVLTNFGGLSLISQATGVVIDSDDNIVAAGTAYQPGQGFDFAVARYIGFSTSGPIVQTEGIVSNVQTLVVGGVLNNGQGNSLEGKLQKAIEDLDDGAANTAINDLQAFINEVNDYISEDILTTEEGQLLIDEAEAVIALIEQEYGSAA